uniref:RNase H type-1 domain-containing protein n=2 Tax=Photinus pyralis TaxID=7054 RepID=A0A1Y1MKC9_PHOPY
MSNTEESFAIVSDSQGALNSIKSRFPRDPLVQRIQAVYSNVVEVGKSIFWIWVPGHVGIRGNVMADEAAKRATGVRHVDVQVVRHLDLKAALRAALVHPKPWRPPLLLSRIERVKIHRLRIGYTQITHAHLLRGEPPTVCVHCGNQMTVEHILRECPVLEPIRQSFHLIDEVGEILKQPQHLKNVIKYLRSANIFDML